jgi:hypothetical protein
MRRLSSALGTRPEEILEFQEMVEAMQPGHAHGPTSPAAPYLSREGMRQ